MRSHILTLLASTALAVPALAQGNPNIPMPTAEDPNMRTTPYSPNARVRLVGTVGKSMLISFAAGEQIKRLVFGDQSEGEMIFEAPDDGNDADKGGEGAGKQAALGNQLPLWPKKAGYTTLQVITKRPDAPDRPYQFALEARDPPAECKSKTEVCDDPRATYGLTFHYPADEQAAKVRQVEEARQRWLAEAPVRAQRREAVQFVTARERLEVSFFEYGHRCMNWRYEAEANDAGRALLVPDKLADNGSETAFQYVGNRQMPSFFTLAPDGKSEQPVMPSFRNNDIAVLPLTAREIHVRTGDAVLYVHNRSYKPEGCDPGTFTGRPDVVRGVRRTSYPAASNPPQ